ncbi:MAG: ribosome biogenesis GTPase Der [Magnetococcales bacterium]|nr:ribosome biogenesis GTPase Der [Magnetococcales bacterium]MBF0418539.1 ribosome biogenesis GTPase Der [Magnetococcales bacterium]
MHHSESVTKNMALVALVGRPNVGKSSLFNRLTRTRLALVDDTPGLTRDRHYAQAAWDGRVFRVVDTGGFEPDQGETIKRQVWHQAQLAVEEADLVVLVLDARVGPLADDVFLADLLRRSGKPVLCAVNKSDGHQGRHGYAEFYSLGLEPVIAISAAHGTGIGELVDALLTALPSENEGDAGAEDDAVVRVAVVGCPNAGKSSLINRLLGEDRLVTSEIPGTTRDSIDMLCVDGRGRRMVLVDTAGIRRKSRIALRIEKFSVLAAIRAIDRSHVVVLVMDALRGITDQDLRVAGLAMEAGKGLVFAVNKWDQMTVGKRTEREFSVAVRDAFPHFSHGRLVFLSAVTGKGVGKLTDEIHLTHKEGLRHISTGVLNRWLRDVVEKHPPPRRMHRLIRLRYMTQVSSQPPTMVIFANLPDQIHETYRRYLENQLREAFGFSGVVIRLLFRKGENPYEQQTQEGT